MTFGVILNWQKATLKSKICCNNGGVHCASIIINEGMNTKTTTTISLSMRCQCICELDWMCARRFKMYVYYTHGDRNAVITTIIRRWPSPSCRLITVGYYTHISSIQIGCFFWTNLSSEINEYRTSFVVIRTEERRKSDTIDM